jgi:hypothetical protein
MMVLGLRKSEPPKMGKNRPKYGYLKVPATKFKSVPLKDLGLAVMEMVSDRPQTPGK